MKSMMTFINHSLKAMDLQHLLSESEEVCALWLFQDNYEEASKDAEEEVHVNLYAFASGYVFMYIMYLYAHIHVYSLGVLL